MKGKTEVEEKFRKASKFIQLPLDIVKEPDFFEEWKLEDVKFLEISEFRVVFILFLRKYLIDFFPKSLILSVAIRNIHTREWIFQEFVLKEFLFLPSSYSLEIRIEGSRIKVFLKDEKGKKEEAIEFEINDFFKTNLEEELS